MLQCRIGKRTGLAALQMAVDMVEEGLIDEKTAVMRVAPAQLDEVLHPILDPSSEKKATVLAQGLQDAQQHARHRKRQRAQTHGLKGSF